MHDQELDIFITTMWAPSSRRKHTCKGSLEAMSREIAWATPVKYIRESMLVELAQRCRHDVPDELRQYPGEPYPR